MNNINLWLWLESKNLSKKIKYSLYKKFGSIEKIYNASKEDISNIDVKISQNNVDKLCDKQIIVDEISKKIKEYKVKLLTIDMEEYPLFLKNIPDPPVVLYTRGKFINLNEKMCVSVVGSRKMSVYGKNVAHAVSKQMAQKGAVIVSGMAYGIDTMAHIGALDGDGLTVAVLGCGVDIVYPKTNKVLMERIIENGMVISEFPMGLEPFNYNFPERNKIVASLSVATVVVEADLKSGSLITADLSKEYGKDVFAVPGNIDSPFAKGTNKLIKEGAYLLTSGDDVINKYPQHKDKLKVIENKKIINNEEKGSPIEQKILNILGKEPVSIDYLCSESKLDIATLNSTLLIMEVKGMIAKYPGNRYSINEGRI